MSRIDYGPMTEDEEKMSMAVAHQVIENTAAFEKQVGGNHYKDMAIQPLEYSHRNGLGAAEAFVVKYVSRWQEKDGIKDLKKAIHCLELLIEMEES